MSSSGNAVKVGIVVLFALMLTVGTIAILGGKLFPRGKTYFVFVHFEEATGIREGMPVKIAGVDKGKVEKIDTVNASPFYHDRKTVAEIKVRMNADTPLHEGAVFEISQEGLLGEKYLAVEDSMDASPAVKEGATLPGVKQPELSELMTKATETLTSVNQLMSPDSLGGSIGNVMESLDETLVGVDLIVADLGGLIGDTRGYMVSSLQNVEATSKNFLALSQNLTDASNSLAGLADDPVYGENFKAMSNDMRAIASNLNQMSFELNRTISDPEVQADTKGMVRASRESMEETRKTIQQFQTTLTKVDALLEQSTAMVSGVNGIMGGLAGELGVDGGEKKPDSTCGPQASKGGGGPIAKVKNTINSVKAVTSTFESRLDIDNRIIDSNRNEKYDSGDDKKVRDINLTLGAANMFVQVGADNIGEDNGWNFLLGRGNPNDGFSYKTGAYRGEVGTGVSYRDGKNAGIDAYMYDANDPKYNVTGKVPMGDSVDIIVGVEDITGDATATVGIGTAL